MTYTVVGTGGCTNATATRTVTITAGPISGIISGIQSICEGSSITFTSTSTGGTWSSSNVNVAIIDSTTGLLQAIDNGNTIISYTVIGTGGCSNAVTSYSITVNEPEVPNFEDITICYGTTAPTLSNVSPNGINGTWQPSIIDNTQDGTYLFTPNSDECALSQTINVFVNQLTLKNVEWEVTTPFSNEHVLTVLAYDSGNYTYQLDNGPSQLSNVFENVNVGSHTIKVEDINGCSQPIIVNNIMVIGFSKFFTPNGDGYNDTWNISSLSDKENSKISIYNRLGQLIKEISPRGTGWDGSFNGKPLPATDYWFTVEYTEDNIVKKYSSHFSLKR
jgi:gliding motility-associated-like protein